LNQKKKKKKGRKRTANKMSMDDYAAVAHLLDEKLQGEWTTVETDLSKGLLDFVREEGPALETKVRVRVLLSLIWTKASQLSELKPSVVSLLQACSDDSDEWVRVVADLVMKWLPNEFSPPVAARASLEDSVQGTLSKLKDVSAKLDQVGRLPVDFCPLHWPFLSSDYMQRLQSHSVTTAGGALVAPAPLVETPAAIANAPTSTAAHAASSAPSSKKSKQSLPEKLLDMLKDAPLLTTEGRQKIEDFFQNPAKMGDVVYVLLSEKHVVKEDGKEEIEQTLIKLDAVLRKWNPTKKRVQKKS